MRAESAFVRSDHEAFPPASERAALTAF
jgi:hypothetical protein